MSDGTRVAYCRPALSPVARAAAAIIATTGVVLLVAACGGSARGRMAQLGSAAATQQNALLAFAACMRSYGVASFPDPDSSGELPKRQIAALAAGSPRFVPAHRSCEHLLPNSGQPTPAQVQRAWSDMRSFARCMRSHGVPTWPGPTVTSPQDNRPFFNVPTTIDPNTPHISTTIRGCQHVMQANNPLVTTQ